MSTFKFFVVVFCGIFVAACNYTDGACYERGHGGSNVAGVGGGPIVPGQGGFGDVPPESQGAGDTPDPCNAGAGKIYTCNGDIVCSKPNQGGGNSTTGCHFAVKTFTAESAEKLVDDLLKKCQAENPTYACSSEELSCTDTPAKRYYCNGGISCVDDNGIHDGCNVGGEPSDPYSSLPGEVYASSDGEAFDHLADLCETLKHDKYGNNCAHGGMCCVPGSVACQKQ
jgi:hypothetical protein